jgi:hypothetical protein
MSKEWYLRKKAEDPNYFKQQRERFYTKHPDYYVKQAKKHYQKNPQVVILGGKRWRQANLEKSNAGFAARRSKVPLKDYCEKCHVTGVYLERHHEDYSKPLEFLTLCRKCHRGIHRELKAKGKTLPSIKGTGHCRDCGKTWPLCGKNRTHKKGRYRCTLWIEKDAGGSKA